MQAIVLLLNTHTDANTTRKSKKKESLVLHHTHTGARTQLGPEKTLCP